MVQHAAWRKRRGLQSMAICMHEIMFVLLRNATATVYSPPFVSRTPKTENAIIAYILVIALVVFGGDTFG